MSNEDDNTTPPQTPPGNPISNVIANNANQLNMNDQVAEDRVPEVDMERPQTPPSPTSPMSPMSASISASAISATDQPRYNFAEMSASIDATPTALNNYGMPRYLGTTNQHQFSGGDVNMEEDNVEAEIRRIAQRSLPRGDLGRREWRLDTSMFSNIHPSSPTSSTRSYQSYQNNPQEFAQENRRASVLPQPPASPTSSPRRTSHQNDQSPNSTASRVFNQPQPTENLSGAVVWGTNISIAESMEAFRSFLYFFRLSAASESMHAVTNDPYYIHQLRSMLQTESFIFNLDTQHLLQYPPARKLYNQLVLFPQVLIRVLDMVVQEEATSLISNMGIEDTTQLLQVRPYNLSTFHAMRELNPSDIDQLVSLKGMVTRCSSMIPDLKEAFFQCSLCRFTTSVQLDRGNIEEPSYCESCTNRNCMEMIHNRSSFTDKQLIKIQETPDAIPEGETPYTMMLFCFDDLVDEVRPGDKVEATGIYRAVPMRVSARQRVVKSIFRTYVDVVHFRRIDEVSNSRNASELENTNTSQVGDSMNQNIPEEFAAIANHPHVYENLAHSLAPSIWQLDDVKKGILCMLFGGTRKDKSGNLINRDASNGSSVTKAMRSEMNILLCGDPGTSKSQLLSYVHRLSKRSIYTSGKGSSAVGLTASVIRDGETGDLVLESGALVLCDEGICCIDEFDKMSDSARSVLHEVMEQQTVSIAKAGIICSLNARASILASANPIESRYNPNKSVIENVNILPTLLSRFDLIYLILDKPQAESDRKLAKHIVAMYFDAATRERREKEIEDLEYRTSTTIFRPQLIPMRKLTEYIAYARQNIHPRLSLEAKDALVKAYLDLRRMGSIGSGGGSHNKKNITATPRQLEALIRLSEALAKMRLQNEVSASDVTESLRLMNVATQKSAMDPRTGTIDMDMINTGHSTAERGDITQYIARIKNILENAPGKSMPFNEIRKKLELGDGQDSMIDQPVPQHPTPMEHVKSSDVQLALRALEDENLIIISQGVIKFLA